MIALLVTKVAKLEVDMVEGLKPWKESKVKASTKTNNH
jgi:hypothetical protein